MHFLVCLHAQFVFDGGSLLSVEDLFFARTVEDSSVCLVSKLGLSHVVDIS